RSLYENAEATPAGVAFLLPAQPYCTSVMLMVSSTNYRQCARDPGELEQLVGLDLAKRDCALPGPEPFDRLAAIDKHPTAAIGHDTEHVTFHFALRVRKEVP